MSVPRILVTLDGSPLATAALPVASDLAAGLRAEVILLQIVPPVTRAPAGTWDLPAAVDLEERRAYEELHRLAAGWFAGRESSAVVLVDAHPVRGIMEWVRQHPVDYIVMATHGHGGIRHLVAGSTTEALIRSGLAPVIAVRPLVVPAPTAR
jgi:nucleotide-binding universal stress UspA family protein